MGSCEAGDTKGLDEDRRGGPGDGRRSEEKGIEGELQLGSWSEIVYAEGRRGAV